MARKLFDRLSAKAYLTVDPIGPIKMKSRTEWIIGEQGAPNYRGVHAVLQGVIPSGVEGSPAETPRSSGGDPSTSLGVTLVEDLLSKGADGIDVLYLTDAEFTERTKDPAVVANLRKAKFLIVHAWDAMHPLAEVADVLIPGAILAEKDGTFTNVQGRVQRIHQAFSPKGQAETDLESLRRVGARLFPNDAEFRTADALDVFAELRGSVPALAEVGA